MQGGRRLGFEIKYSAAPALTKSMRSAIAALRLDRLDVVHAGTETFPLHEKARAVALDRLGKDIEPLA